MWLTIWKASGFTRRWWSRAPARRRSWNGVLLQAYEARGARPDVQLLDGQGIAHPRGIGLASHVGLWQGIPTIGCAKSRLCGEHDEPGLARGDWRPLTCEGRTIGSINSARPAGV